MMKDKKNLSRREFLKLAGISAVAATAAGTIYSCKPGAGGGATSAGQPVPTGEMTYRTSATGDRVSILGYGCMRWPMKGNEVDQETVNRLVDYAIEHGVNYFDTAPVYVQGLSEKVTGIALKRHPREKYFIATKLSNFGHASRENSLKMYHQSFSELQVDYIDYYLLHSLGGGGMDAFRTRFVDNGMMDFLMEERKAGRIRNLGFSFHGNADQFDEFLKLHDTYHWDFVQVQLNYVDWDHAGMGNTNASLLYDGLVKYKIPAVVMEPLLGGRLSKLPTYVINHLKQRRPDDSAASWAFRFAGSLEGVMTVLSGMTYMEHLQDNVRTYSPLVPLTADERTFLEGTAEIIRTYPTIPCNDCDYCMPCPYGINIPAILLHYNKCVNEGNIPKDSGDANYRSARRAFLVGYNRDVETLRQADHCIGCNECTPLCPQRIRIPQELQRIDKFVEKLKREGPM
ncbi:MAG: aldo/keto reductase [Prevotellaceae bacterium]|jgi:predicted aldo/keto reductase-like oxidoreductase|nr:aldo/keto reductase [Prevotellaceae bacterium]